jgi:hypothetical protein
MRNICSILIFMMAVHSQCRAQCLSADLDHVSPQNERLAEQPPCHQHPQNSATVPNGPGPSGREHDKGNSCGQVQSLEFKTSTVSDCLQDTAIEFVAPLIALQQAAGRRTFGMGAEASCNPSPQESPFVLRI